MPTFNIVSVAISFQEQFFSVARTGSDFQQNLGNEIDKSCNIILIKQRDLNDIVFATALLGAQIARRQLST